MSETTIPASYLDLFEKKTFAHLATLMPNGTPQVTPVWIDYDGTFVLVNSEGNRQKTRNVQRNPHVALSILDPEDPYRYIQVRGSVVEIVKEGAKDHIDKLSRRYTGVDYQNHNPNSPRVIMKIKPEHILLR